MCSSDLTHHLILSCGLYRKLDVYRPHLASAAEMTRFHSDDYVAFLERVTPDNVRPFVQQMTQFNVGECTDCPVYEGLFEFQQIASGVDYCHQRTFSSSKGRKPQSRA